jgi:hypothetical protein
MIGHVRAALPMPKNPNTAGNPSRIASPSTAASTVSSVMPKAVI